MIGMEFFTLEFISTDWKKTGIFNVLVWNFDSV